MNKNSQQPSEITANRKLETKNSTDFSKCIYKTTCSQIVHAKMGIFRMMSVGRSGVGKSTIGNMFLFGEGEGDFPTSSGSVSCTHEVKELKNKGGDCAYVDVPGLPDTHPKNIAQFYDAVVQEAKKELNVILFVFKRDRIDQAAYKLAELLFRELNKANVAKILVINDHNNYRFKEPPTEEEYRDQVETIKRMVKIDFTHYVIFTGETMKEKLHELRITMSETESCKSEHLKNFNELKQYVEVLREKRNYKEEAVILQEQRIAFVQGQITFFQKILAVSAAGAAASFIVSFFKPGILLPIAVLNTMNAGLFVTVIKSKMGEMEGAIDMIRKEDLMVISRELEEACEKLNELKQALDIN